MGIEEILQNGLDNQENRKYILRLYVSGITPKSQKAIKNLKSIIGEYQGDFELEIIDIYQNPELAIDSQIIAAPTLIKELPIPIRKFIGDMSDKEKIVLGLELKKKK
jgi:circadian clock protein KaiB